MAKRGCTRFSLRTLLGKFLGFSPERHPSYARLRKIPAVATVIDVGVGDQGSPFLYSRFPDSFFISIDCLFEAAEAVKRHLPESRSYFVQTAVGAENSETNFQVSAKPSRTSLLERFKNDWSSAPVEERITTIRKLDDVIEEFESLMGSLEMPLLLKIDIEGYELECLRGATRVLSKTSYIILECPLTDNFENSYSFSDLVGFMAKHSFELFQVLKAGNNSMDLLFTRANSPLRQIWTYGNMETI